MNHSVGDSWQIAVDRRGLATPACYDTTNSSYAYWLLIAWPKALKLGHSRRLTIVYIDPTDNEIASCRVAHVMSL